MAVHWPTPSIVRFISDQSLLRCKNKEIYTPFEYFNRYLNRKGFDNQLTMWR